MLNSKAISDLLSRNSDDRLCKRWFLMTLHGTLLAYTQPINIRDLRKQAAMATLSWQEQQQILAKGAASTDGVPGSMTAGAPLRTLTIESESSNLIISRIHTQLLLVLEGGVPRRRVLTEPRITPESVNDPACPSQDGSSSEPLPGSSVSSAANSTTSKATVTSVLSLQRKKLDALASIIAQELEDTGFKMPEMSVTRIL